MTPEEASQHLAAIRGVVDRARQERVRNGDIYVVWGVVIVLCDAITLGADALGASYGWVSYPVICTLAAAWTAWTARSRGLRRDTYGARIEGVVWFSVGGAIFALLAGGLGTGALPLTAVTPIVSAFAGVALVVSGTIYREPLLTRPGQVFLVLAPLLFLFGWRAQYALFGVAMIAGYIVPGMLLMRQERDAG